MDNISELLEISHSLLLNKKEHVVFIRRRRKILREIPILDQMGRVLNNSARKPPIQFTKKELIPYPATILHGVVIQIKKAKSQ